MPDREAGWHGTIAGAVLGIIPAAVTVITSQPPSGSSGYPVLDFLGGTAWNLFFWVALGYVQLFVFLMVTTVIVCDLRTLKKAGLGPADWVRVQNWRFTVTWSTALVAAISTAAVAFLSTVAADFTNQTLTSNSTSQQQGPKRKHGRIISATGIVIGVPPAQHLP